MFNNYYEDKPVGYDSIPEQKEAMGYEDGTYIEFGKGVTGKSQYAEIGFNEFTSGTYSANDIVTHDGKLYYYKSGSSVSETAWDATKWTAMTKANVASLKMA